jgi:hypothetical protein
MSDLKPRHGESSQAAGPETAEATPVATRSELFKRGGMLTAALVVGGVIGPAKLLAAPSAPARATGQSDEGWLVGQVRSDGRIDEVAVPGESPGKGRGRVSKATGIRLFPPPDVSSPFVDEVGYSVLPVALVTGSVVNAYGTRIGSDFYAVSVSVETAN